MPVSSQYDSRPPPQKRARYHHSSSSETIRPERDNRGPGRADLSQSDTGTQVTRDEDDDEEEEEEETIMAIDYSRKKLGCAFYRSVEDKLYLVTDVDINLYGAAGTIGTELYNALKFQIEPTMILFPSRADDLVNEDKQEDPFQNPAAPTFRIRPAAEFSFERGKAKLASLKIGDEDAGRFLTPGWVNEPGAAQREGVDPSIENLSQKFLQLLGWLDAESNEVSVGCAGAILAEIKRKRAIMDPFAEGDELVGHVGMWSMDKVMYVNADTITSLQIFNNEAHPSFNRSASRNSSLGKEGSLCLFNLFRSTKTPQGHHRLKFMFLRPSTDLELLTERQETIHAFTRVENSPSVSSIQKSLNKISDMSKIITKLKKGTCSSSGMNVTAAGGRGGKAGTKSEWMAILQFCVQSVRIRTSMTEMHGIERLEIYEKIINSFEVMHLENVARVVDNTVDFEESKLLRRTCVRRHIDPDLDELKRQENGLEDFLCNVAQDIVHSLPAYARESGLTLNVVCFPQIGYLIAIPIDPKTELASYAGEGRESEENGGPWENMFSTDTTVYFKNGRMRELDEQLGDIFSRIIDREIEILHDLQIKVLEYEEIILNCSSILGELDSLISLADAVGRYNLVKPTLTEENILNIQGGRHILQEQCVNVFVPNNTRIAGGEGQEGGNENERPSKSLVLLTGPNFSGKSVYLKQVALIVYLAHIGSFVPAESATIGLTDKIMTRIQTRESVSKIQSAFMIDLQQISIALRLATSRSLLIIDEFGKGTESTDGAGLACAVFEHLLDRGTEAPKVIAASHYHELFENGFLVDDPRVSFQQMKIHIDKSARKVEGQITYLYKVAEGRSMNSFGTDCASMNGISPKIIRRAEDLILLSARCEDLVAACAVVSEEEKMEAETAETIAQRFMETVFEDPEDFEMEDGESITKKKLQRLLDTSVPFEG